MKHSKQVVDVLKIAVTVRELDLTYGELNCKLRKLNSAALKPARIFNGQILRAQILRRRKPPNHGSAFLLA